VVSLLAVEVGLEVLDLGGAAAATAATMGGRWCRQAAAAASLRGAWLLPALLFFDEA
jgi:hypothetical protein